MPMLAVLFVFSIYPAVEAVQLKSIADLHNILQKGEGHATALQKSHDHTHKQLEAIMEQLEAIQKDIARINEKH